MNRRKNISEHIKRELWSRSGGYCQNPECNIDLFRAVDSKCSIPIDELAHIIPYSTNGPRSELQREECDSHSYLNLIVLCPTCHTVIDKVPENFPVEMLMSWKSNHEVRIKAALGVTKCKNKQLLFRHISRLTRENRAIFNLFSPRARVLEDPNIDYVSAWHRHAIQKLIPNNREILACLHSNDHLLNKYEKDLVETFALHIEGFAYNCVSGQKESAVIEFPPEMNELFGESPPTVIYKGYEKQVFERSLDKLRCQLFAQRGIDEILEDLNGVLTVKMMNSKSYKVFPTDFYIIGEHAVFEILAEYPDIDTIVNLGFYHCYTDDAFNYCQKRGVKLYKMQEFIESISNHDETTSETY